MPKRFVQCADFTEISKYSVKLSHYMTDNNNATFKYSLNEGSCIHKCIVYKKCKEAFFMRLNSHFNHAEKKIPHNHSFRALQSLLQHSREKRQVSLLDVQVKNSPIIDLLENAPGTQIDEDAGGLAYLISLTEEALAEQAEAENELISEDSESDLFATTAPGEQRDAVNGVNSSGSTPLDDNSATLTRRLVAAKRMLQVQDILGDAFKDLINLRKAAATGDEETAKAARAIIRKLEKLVRRGNRKISDLNNEDRMRRERDKAALELKKQRAKEIAAELRTQIRKRKNREQGYLDELMRDAIMGATKNQISQQLDAATEAKIAAMADAKAAAEVMAASSAGGAGSGVGDFSSSTSDGSISGSSAEVSGGMEGAVAGSVDVSV